MLPVKYSLSVVVPVYNEAENLPEFLKTSYNFLRENIKDFELLVVNDGSQDESAQILSRFSSQFPEVKIITHLKNRGYGAALRSGFKNASKDLIFFIDGDNQFNISELVKFLPEIQNFDVIIGWRKERKDTIFRKINAWLWNFLIRLLFKLKVRDLDCAFKLFKRGLIEIEKLKSEGALINAELLARFRKSNIRIKEIPVTHRARCHGKQTGANLKVILKAFSELIQLYQELK